MSCLRGYADCRDSNPTATCRDSNPTATSPAPAAALPNVLPDHQPPITWQCFCSADADVAALGGRTTEGADCTDTTYACSGDSSEICGGFNAIQVYQFVSGGGPTPTPPTPTPAPEAAPTLQPVEPTPTSGTFSEVNCYVDSTSDRLFSIKKGTWKDPDMTSEVRDGLISSTCRASLILRSSSLG